MRLEEIVRQGSAFTVQLPVIGVAVDSSDINFDDPQELSLVDERPSRVDVEHDDLIEHNVPLSGCVEHKELVPVRCVRLLFCLCALHLRKCNAPNRTEFFLRRRQISENIVNQTL